MGTKILLKSDMESEYYVDSEIVTDSDDNLLDVLNLNADEGNTIEKRDVRKKNFKCSVCPLSFINQTSLQHHEEWHINPKKFSCKICGSKFMSTSYLKRHYLEHKDVECEICSRIFKDGAILVHHYKSCGTKKSAAKRKRKVPSENSTEGWTCKICSKIFYCMTSVRDHKLWHRKPEAFKCQYCFVKFAHRRSLKYHEKSHFRTEKFPCPECGKEFGHRDNMRKHMVMHSDSMKDDLTCQFCKKVLCLRNSKIKHEVICKKNPLNIDYKGNKNSDSDEYKEGPKKRKRSKKYNRCYTCQKRFPSKEEQQKHVNSKVCVKDSTCQYCRRILSSRNSLRRHVNTCPRKKEQLVKVEDNKGPSNFSSDQEYQAYEINIKNRYVSSDSELSYDNEDNESEDELKELKVEASKTGYKFYNDDTEENEQPEDEPNELKVDASDSDVCYVNEDDEDCIYIDEDDRKPIIILDSPELDHRFSTNENIFVMITNERNE